MWRVFLLGLLCCGVVLSQSCSTTSNRIDCKQYNQAQCVAEGCCWSPVNPNPSNLPWCFYQNTGAPVCNTQAPREDCGYSGITQSECEQRDCCWNPVNPNPNNLPYCYQSNPLSSGYTVVNSAKNGSSIILTLQAVNSTDNLYGTLISPLQVIASYDTNNQLHVKIIDPSRERWEVPQWLIPRSDTPQSSSNMQFNWVNNPFGFSVTRGGDVLFNSSVPQGSSWNGLQFKDQYLSLSTQLPADSAIYGLQESTQSNGFRLTQRTFTMWNHDTPSAATNTNLYGSHPFYLQMLNGKAHGVLLLNSDGMDVDYYSDHLTYNVIGGVLDFYFFNGPTADNVVQQYSTLIGLPHMEPYWSYGFHQCRYGMPNLAYVEGVVANYSAANIPLDTIWGDIDYMDAYKDFTWDPVNYPLSQVQSFTQQLHSQHQQYVVILDPGILYNDNSYSSYTELIANSDAYIKDVNGNPFVGQVWPGYTIFPDFLSTAGQDYWDGQLRTFLGQVPYDGLWVDMNEASNFCSGECLNGSPIPLGSTTCGCSNSDVVSMFTQAYLSDDYQYGSNYSSGFDPMNPPYAINNNEVHNPLNNKAIDPNAYHIVNGEKILEYDAHNLLGLAEARQTHLTLESLYNRRSFVLTRSSFVSSGHWTAKWTGDNSSDWPDLYYSILGVLNFNILGVPMIGADICGFNGATTEELCARWIELGAFYPFSRNHNAINEPLQELYRWPTVSAISSYILRVRYSVLPLYYTLNYHASTEGSPIIRPLFFQFPQDSSTLNMDKQFLVGSTLMVVPVLDQGATSVNGYFPAGVWYDYYTLAGMSFSQGTNLNINAPLDTIPLYILGGSILPARDSPQLTTYDTNTQPFNLTVALDANQQAIGDLFVDDGYTLNYQTEGVYIEFQAKPGVLTSTVGANSFSSSDISTALNTVRFLGVPSSPSQVTVNGNSWTSFTYNNQVLTLTSLSLDVTKEFTITY